MFRKQPGAGTTNEQWEPLAVCQGSFGPGEKLECLVRLKKGFLVAGSNGFTSVYEKELDEKEPFILLKAFRVGVELIEYLAVCPTNETAIACTKSAVMMSFSLGNVDIMQDNTAEYQLVFPKVRSGLFYSDLGI